MKAVLGALLVLGFGSANAQEVTLSEASNGPQQQVSIADLLGYTLTGVIEQAEVLPGNRGDTCTLKFTSATSKGVVVEVGSFGFDGTFTLSEQGAPEAQIQTIGISGHPVKRKLFLAPAAGGFSYRLVDQDGNTDILCLGVKPGVY